MKGRENKQRFPVNEVHWGPGVWECEGLVLFKAKLLCYSVERRRRTGGGIGALGLRVTGCNNILLVLSQLGISTQ